MLEYNTIMQTMIGLLNANELIMCNSKDKQSVNVMHMLTFKMAKQKNESEIFKNKPVRFYFMPSVAGHKPSIFIYGPILSDMTMMLKTPSLTHQMGHHLPQDLQEYNYPLYYYCTIHLDTPSSLSIPPHKITTQFISGPQEQQ